MPSSVLIVFVFLRFSADFLLPWSCELSLYFSISWWKLLILAFLYLTGDKSDFDSQSVCSSKLRNWLDLYPFGEYNVITEIFAAAILLYSIRFPLITGKLRSESSRSVIFTVSMSISICFCI